MDLKDYHKEELQILLMAVSERWATPSTTNRGEQAILKAWIYRIRLALKDK